MNPLLQWLASEAWAHVVQALLHTLWIGALLVLGVMALLRRIADPFRRYRCCMAGLGGVLLGGLIAWSVLDAHFDAPTPPAAAASAALVPQAEAGAAKGPGKNGSSPIETGHGVSSHKPQAGGGLPEIPAPPHYGWRCWVALFWLAGAAGMLVRAAVGVGAAEKLRRSAQPLEDDRLVQLLREARRRLGMTRRIRLAVTDKLTSPAVVGVVVPTLILPLSLLTALPPNQLQLLLLHELAHIRRGDYLANLCQFLLESLLFFNPAVWWLSRQARQEREACCDALAASLAEDRVEYARALTLVAEQSLGPTPALAPGFADQRHPSSLKDRIRRLLMPGYLSTPRLTWKALAGWVLAGGGLLLLSALGTQWTILAAARLLTPEQRIARIEAHMEKLGQAPADFTGRPDRQVEVEARLRTAGGSPLPDRTWAGFLSTTRNSTYLGGASVNSDGVCRTRVPAGDLYFSAMARGYAPACLGPIDIRSSNRVEGLELVLQPGFPITLVAVDADSGAPLGGVSLACQFWMPQGGPGLGSARELTTDREGKATLEHCAALPLRITVTKRGYETCELRVGSPRPDQRLKIATRRALLTSGSVSDQATKQPIAGAQLHVLRAEAAPGFPSGQDPDHLGAPLATTDARGQFQLDSLSRSGRFWLLVKAEHHAATIVSGVYAGQTNLQIALGPELLVRGHFKGDLKLLSVAPGEPRIAYRNSYKAGNCAYGTLAYAPVHTESGVARFEFVSPIAGTVEVQAGDEVFRRDVTRPIKDWLIDLTAQANAAAMRTVILQFVHPSGIPPKGTVAVLLPGKEPHTATRKEIEIRNGEVSFEVLVGRHFGYELAHTIGYWFEQQYNMVVTNGPGPLRLEVPVVPAGAIYAQARQVDGTIAGNVSFSVRELKKSPLAKTGWPTTPSCDNWSPDGGPRHYIASPLPLEGIYFVVASQSNHFAVSDPIKLTAAAPEQKVELQFGKGAPIEGRVLAPDGRPMGRAPVSLDWSYKEAGFGLPTGLTDENGHFSFQECTADLGQYSLLVRIPGMRTTSRPVSFRRLPLTIRLEPGLKLSGRVVDLESGRPIVDVEVRAWTDSLRLPTESARTDERGRFVFNTLNPAKYHLCVDSCNFPNGTTLDQTAFHAGSPQALVLKVQPVQGARVRLGEP